MLSAILFSACLTITIGAPAWSADQADTADASVELHMLSVNEGNIRTGDRIHGPEVNISVNRPGREVALALGSRSPVRFLITAEAETAIGKIMLFGRGAQRSEVFINSKKQDDIHALDRTRAVFNPQGTAFRDLLKRLTERAGVDRLTSFQGEQRQVEKTLLVNAVSDDPSFQRQYLGAFVEDDRLTETLRASLDAAIQSAAMLTTEGFMLTQDGRHAEFPITLDVPPVSHAVAAAHDPDTNRLYGVTLGGEGFLYQYDIASETWSVVSSMNNRDATGMIYDPLEKRLLISVEGRGREGGLLMQWSEENGLRSLTLGIRVSDLPGLTDIFEPGGGRLPSLVPLALDGRLLLVRVYPAHYRQHHRQNQPEPMSRTYIFDLETGDTALVAYNGD